MPNVSRLVGTISISSAFWMGLFRGDCPVLASHLLAWEREFRLNGSHSETLDVIKSGVSGLCSRLKALAINAFPFEAMKETLHGRVIIAIACPTPTHLNALPLQDRLIAFSGRGTPPIKMMH